ncbi:hypothetical protein PsAD5_02627 [Pseudovibrio sp. Ad5]|uniref:hypothetical protein n=1 Tax=Pseudovibrio sp. Ad5 TaxID=989436 RepID=UPI0007B1D6BE|nr:hypothetical protein [Pseudovibrio sp. Ad5]KZK96434.1 hypothetical protein PsAD5_02627 [Pseudovibrio sp. Ad5]
MNKLTYTYMLAAVILLTPKAAISSDILESACAYTQDSLEVVVAVWEEGAPIPTKIDGYVLDDTNSTAFRMRGLCEEAEPEGALFICKALAGQPVGFMPDRFHFDILASGRHADVPIDSGRVGCLPRK